MHIADNRLAPQHTQQIRIRTYTARPNSFACGGPGEETLYNAIIMLRTTTYLVRSLLPSGSALLGYERGSVDAGARRDGDRRQCSELLARSG